MSFALSRDFAPKFLKVLGLSLDEQRPVRRVTIMLRPGKRSVYVDYEDNKGSFVWHSAGFDQKGADIVRIFGLNLDCVVGATIVLEADGLARFAADTYATEEQLDKVLFVFDPARQPQQPTKPKSKRPKRVEAVGVFAQEQDKDDAQ